MTCRITGDTLPLMASVTIRDLRNHGGEVVDRVEAGEQLTVTRDGRPVAELRPVRSRGIPGHVGRAMAPAARRRRRCAPTRHGRPHRPVAVSDPEGLLDTSAVLALRGLRDTALLPDVALISAVTLAELSVGPLVASDDAERARRQAQLQQAEADFDPIPFDARAARAYAQVAAAYRRSGRKSAVRSFDAMIGQPPSPTACPSSPQIPPTSPVSTTWSCGRFPHPTWSHEPLSACNRSTSGDRASPPSAGARTPTGSRPGRAR